MTDIKHQQLKVLKKDLSLAVDTIIGKKYGFQHINQYSDYINRVPFHTYSDIEQYITDIKGKKSDVLWPGKMHNFAVSSGTTGSGKHLPLSEERLKSDYRFMRNIVLNYLRQKPNPVVFGPQLSLPGSLEYDPDQNIHIGEISAFLAQMVPFYLKPFQVLPMVDIVSSSWNNKFNQSIRVAIKKDIRVINAVPSWTLILFQKALEITGKHDISEIWPNLQLITGGGVALSSYKTSLEKLCGPLKPDFMEFYGSSEGYFAYTDTLGNSDLKLITNNGIFFEWFPYEKWTNRPDNDDILPTWEIKENTPYVMIITNNSGLWRYPMNDIVEFTDASHFKIKVSGRVNEMLDEYGEALHFQEAQKGLISTEKETGASHHLFFLASTLDNHFDKPRHIWFINWKKYPNNPDNFIQLLDEKICRINRHYAIRRESGALGLPKILPVDDTILDKWLSHKTDVSAQTKIPRIIRDRKSISSLCNIADIHPFQEARHLKKIPLD